MSSGSGGDVPNLLASSLAHRHLNSLRLSDCLWKPQSCTAQGQDSSPSLTLLTLVQDAEVHAAQHYPKPEGRELVEGNGPPLRSIQETFLP